MPGRSKGRGQTKCDPLVLQVRNGANDHALLKSPPLQKLNTLTTIKPKLGKLLWGPSDALRSSPKADGSRGIPQGPD